MNINYTFAQPENDAQNFYYYKQGFTNDELNKIENVSVLFLLSIIIITNIII